MQLSYENALFILVLFGKMYTIFMTKVIIKKVYKIQYNIHISGSLPNSLVQGIGLKRSDIPAL